MSKFEEDLRRIIELYDNGDSFHIAVKKVISKVDETLCSKCKYKNNNYCFRQRCKV